MRNGMKTKSVSLASKTNTGSFKFLFTTYNTHFTLIHQFVLKITLTD